VKLTTITTTFLTVAPTKDPICITLKCIGYVHSVLMEEPRLVTSFVKKMTDVRRRKLYCLLIRAANLLHHIRFSPRLVPFTKLRLTSRAKSREEQLSTKYESASRSFRTGRLERELQMVRLSRLSATRCSCIAIL
jgi:hypothetical protein